jgi:sugar lactone lactonase YvrE
MGRLLRLASMTVLIMTLLIASPNAFAAQTATPVLTPVAGAYAPGQTVTITDATPGAVIYYMVHGVTPTTSSPRYTGPIPVSDTETVSAIAVAPGFSQSAVASALYTENYPTAATPVLSPVAGAYGPGQTVTITDTTPGAVIRYMVHGVTPTASSPLYTGPIPVSDTETVSAIAIAPRFRQSAVASALYTEIYPTAATPVLSPVAGAYGSGQTVTITDATQGATIYYAVHGLNPTMASTKYTGPIPISGSETVRAIAGGLRLTTSAVASATYTEIYPTAVTPVFQLASGTYSTVQTIAITDATPGATIYYTENGETPTLSSNKYTGPISLSSNRNFKAIAGGAHFTTSAVASAIYTIQLLAAAPVFNPPGGAYVGPQTVSITSATPTALIFYTTNNSYPTTSSPRYTGPILVAASKHVIAIAAETGFTASAPVRADYIIGATTSAPTFSPGPGAFAVNPVVTISDANPAATIHYTLDGSTPTTASPLYTAPVTLTSTTTISALAVAPGYNPGTATATYTLDPFAPAPTFSPAAGSTYTSNVAVTISDAASGAMIYYTTDGSVPTTASAPYTGPVLLTASSQLKAIAIAPNFRQSPVGSASYVIALPERFIYTFAGDRITAYSGDGGLATSAGLNLPQDVALDTAGNVYVADSANNLIRKVSATTGIITTVAGTSHPGYSGDGGAATSAKLNAPTGLAFDNSGDLYFADQSNNVVRKITLSTGVITTVAGTGTAGYSGDGGAATSAQLHLPHSLVFDSHNNLYIADYFNFAIRKVTAGTGVIHTIAGNGLQGNGGNGGLATAAQFYSCAGLAIDSADNIYVSDFAVDNVRKITASTGIITGLVNRPGSDGDGGPASNAGVNGPEGLAVDSQGNLFIATPGDGRIREIIATTGIITTVAGRIPPGAMTFSGDGGISTAADLNSPLDVAVDGRGNLFIADTQNNVIREVTLVSTPPSTSAEAPEFSPAGGSYPGPTVVQLSSSTSGAAIYYTTDGSTPTNKSAIYGGSILAPAMETLKAIAIAPGTVASSAASASYNITGTPTAVVSTIAGNGIYGVPTLGGSATNSALCATVGIAIGSLNDVYFSGCSRVLKVSASTGLLTLVAGNGSGGSTGNGGPATNATFYTPFHLTFDSAGNLYIADENGGFIREVSASTGIISQYAGNVNLSSGYSGDGGPATSAQLYAPTGLAADSAGNLYFADSANYRIRKVAAGTGIITTVAGVGIVPNLYTGDGGPATSAAVNNPQSVALDSSGNLYIADTSNQVIRKISASTGIITTIAGNGDRGYSGDGGPATAAELTLPSSIALDSAGNLYINDSGNNVVREISASTGIISTVAGNGLPGFNGDGDPAILTSFNGIATLALDSSGNLYLADQGNERIRKVTFSGAP